MIVQLETFYQILSKMQIYLKKIMIKSKSCYWNCKSFLVKLYLKYDKGLALSKFTFTYFFSFYSNKLLRELENQVLGSEHMPI